MTDVNSDQADPCLSRALLKRLSAGGNKQRQDSLARLEAACDLLVKEGREITYASAGERCEKLFKLGPKKDTVRQQPHFKAYVDARIAEAKAVEAPSRPKHGRGSSDATFRAIERITDDNLRMQMRNVRAEYLEARQQLLDIAAVLRELETGLDVETLIRRRKANPGHAVSAVRPASLTAASPEEVGALRALLAIMDDAELLGRFGLHFDGKRVRRAKGLGDELIPLNVVAGLKKLHRSLTAGPLRPLLDGSDLGDV